MLLSLTKMLFVSPKQSVVSPMLPYHLDLRDAVREALACLIDDFLTRLTRNLCDIFEIGLLEYIATFIGYNVTFNNLFIFWPEKSSENHR